MDAVGLVELRVGWRIIRSSFRAGEQQRVTLAGAFINRPKILFCDEPTGNLDGATAQAMVELIFELNREQGATLVLVTHDLELAGKCGRVEKDPAMGTGLTG